MRATKVIVASFGSVLLSLSTIGKADQWSQATTLLFQAAASGSVADARVAINAGADTTAIDVNSKSAAYIAAENGHIPLLQYFAQRGVKAPSGSENPVFLAIDQNNSALFEATVPVLQGLNQSSSRGIYYLNALHYAVLQHRFDFAARLEELGSSINDTMQVYNRPEIWWSMPMTLWAMIPGHEDPAILNFLRQYRTKFNPFQAVYGRKPNSAGHTVVVNASSIPTYLASQGMWRELMYVEATYGPLYPWLSINPSYISVNFKTHVGGDTTPLLESESRNPLQKIETLFQVSSSERAQILALGFNLNQESRLHEFDGTGTGDFLETIRYPIHELCSAKRAQTAAIQELLDYYQVSKDSQQVVTRISPNGDRTVQSRSNCLNLVAESYLTESSNLTAAERQSFQALMAYLDR